MRLRTFRIVNFKSFVDTGTHELDAINVFIGRNNTGKSAIIRAISLLQAGSAAEATDVRIGAPNAQVELGLSDVRYNKYFQVAPADDTPHDTDLSITYPFNSGAGLRLRVSGGQAGVNQIPNREPDNFIYPYLSRRKVSQFDQLVDQERTTVVPNDLRYLVSKVARLSNREHERAEEYERLCMEVFGFRISTVPSQGGQRAGIPIGPTASISIEAMGEGVSSLLGLITELCMADGHLFLLEEPENDIHPDGLKAMLRAIVSKANKNQFIVSTHSHLVAKYLGAYEHSRLFSVSMEHARGQAPSSTIRQVSQSPEARIALLHQLGYELYDFDLWEGWLILEESSAERIIRDYLVYWFTPKLRRVRTIAAGGVERAEPTMEDFNRLFCFAHLETRYRNRAWVVVDGGQRGVAVVSNLRKRFSGWPADHFRIWSKADFEEYFPARFEAKVRASLALPHDQKREAKRRLLLEVLKWCDDNADLAKREFETSASEVVAVLREIEAKLFAV